MLRELLSPTHLESTTGGSEELAKGLGVSSEQIDKALSVLSPEKVQQLSDELGHELFGKLLTKDGKIIHDVSRELDLVGNDAEAIEGIQKTLRSEKIQDGELENAFSELVKFTEHYDGKVSGEFAYRFATGNASKLNSVGARGEIKTAEDLLEGKTPLGSISEVKGIPENEPPKGGSKNPEDEFKTPDFLATGSDGTTHLVEVKTPTGDLSKNNLQKNLKKSILSIEGSNIKPTANGYIRLDYRQAPPTSKTSNDIFNFVNGQLVSLSNDGINTGVVEYIEVLYNDTANQAQKLVFQWQNNKLVLLP